MITLLPLNIALKSLLTAWVIFECQRAWHKNKIIHSFWKTPEGQWHIKTSEHKIIPVELAPYSINSSVISCLRFYNHKKKYNVILFSDSLKKRNLYSLNFFLK